jgi:hypothetical protein
VSGHERERLGAYLDGEVPPGERAEVEAHLAACPECTAWLSDTTAVDAAAASLPAEAPEGYFDAFPSRVVARLGAAAQAPARRRRLPAWTWAAAATLLLAVVAPLTLRQTAPGPAPATPPGLSAPRPARADADQKAERDALSAKGTPPAPAAGLRPAFASPPAAALPAAPDRPAAAENRLAAGKSVENEVASEDGRGPRPPAAAPTESATSRPKWADAPAQSAVRDEPALVTTEAFAAPEGARATEDRAPAPASAPVSSSAHRDERTAAAQSVPEPGRVFERLEASRPRTAAEWRRLRDAWNAFAAAHSDDPRADEARVRAIEAGREAWLAGDDEDDEAAFHRDARAYLEREDALQKERVERLLQPPRRP